MRPVGHIEAVHVLQGGISAGKRLVYSIQWAEKVLTEEARITLEIRRDIAREHLRQAFLHKWPTPPEYAFRLYEMAEWPIPKSLLWVGEKREQDYQKIRQVMKRMGYR